MTQRQSGFANFLLVILFCTMLLCGGMVHAQGDSTPSSEDNATENNGAENNESETDTDTTVIESEGDVEIAVNEGAEEAKKTAGDAFDALSKGDLVGAASKSGELFTRFGIPAITVLLAIVLAYFVASFLARLCSSPVRSRVDETLGRFVGKLVFYLIMVSSLLGVLQYFGIGIASFAAVLAAAGFAVGLAFQGTLSNFSSGIMLLVFRPFKVGDVINAAGITAKVNEIDLFTTTFDTPDNRRIIVPNSAIAGGTIENISFHSERRADVSVGTDYSADLQATRDALTAAAESLKDKLVEGDGRGYQIVLGELGDSAIGWTVRFWTTADDFWSVKEELTAAVKTKLGEAGIGIPYPTLDVNVQQN